MTNFVGMLNKIKGYKQSDQFDLFIDDPFYDQSILNRECQIYGQEKEYLPLSDFPNIENSIYNLSNNMKEFKAISDVCYHYPGPDPNDLINIGLVKCIFDAIDFGVSNKILDSIMDILIYLSVLDDNACLDQTNPDIFYKLLCKLNQSNKDIKLKILIFLNNILIKNDNSNLIRVLLSGDAISSLINCCLITENIKNTVITLKILYIVSESLINADKIDELDKFNLIIPFLMEKLQNPDRIQTQVLKCFSNLSYNEECLNMVFHFNIFDLINKLAKNGFLNQAPFIFVVINNIILYTQQFNEFLNDDIIKLGLNSIKSHDSDFGNPIFLFFDSLIEENYPILQKYDIFSQFFEISGYCNLKKKIKITFFFVHLLNYLLDDNQNNSKLCGEMFEFILDYLEVLSPKKLDVTLGVIIKAFEKDYQFYIQISEHFGLYDSLVNIYSQIPEKNKLNISYILQNFYKDTTE